MHAHYRLFVLNLLLSGLVMYLVMFAMIAGRDDFYNNLNMFYMTLMMVAPMAIIMMATMASMYTNKQLNVALYAVFAALFVAAFLFIRNQSGIGDRQFVQSMIPHHSGAILMCREAPLQDKELVTLCAQIIDSQQREIDQMKSILTRMGSND